MSTRLLVLCPDPIGERMSGMGIRYTEIARALGARGVNVTLAGSEIVGAPPSGVTATTWPADRVGPLRSLLAKTDAVLSPPAAPHVTRAMRRSGAQLAFDLYDPQTLEVLERFRTASAPLRRLHAVTASDKLADALRCGHFFVCATERQRDLWIGAMLGLGLLTPAAYDRDPTLRAIVDLLPFGVPDEPPVRGQADPIRTRFRTIADDDEVVLWNGGLWSWLDAPGAIRALSVVRGQGRPARLVFMGASSAGGAGGALAQARSAADRLGLLDDAVLFNDAWVPYAERSGWLLAADAGMSTHREHLETRFAFRTRLLDCFWAGLPPVVSGGDALADEIAREELGAVAPPGDDEALAAGLFRVLDRGRTAYASALAGAAERHTWGRVVEPLAGFLRGADPPTRSRRPASLSVPPALHARRGAQTISRAARLLRP